MNNFEKYFNDLIKIDSQLAFEIGIKNKFAISNYTNTLSDEYNKKLYELYYKYENTNDDELKLSLNLMKEYIDKKYYLYLIISSYTNFILWFEYYNDNIYPLKYKEKRINDFNIYINTVIERLKEGLKLKITCPYMICKEFMEQIHDKNNILYKFLKKEYLKKCRKTIGLYDLPNGNELYKHLILETLAINKSPEEIHKLGLSLLPKKINYVDNQFFKSRNELFKECKKISLYIFNNVIDKYFYYKPKKPFIIRKVPKKLENSMSLAYYNPKEDIIFINLKFYKECGKKSLWYLLFHECFHQYHFRFMKKYKLKKYQIYGYDNQTLIEGFAHYMETYYENYEEDNEYSILRIIRLIADTGINYYKWSYKKTYNFMKKYLLNKKEDISHEIKRYICNPTQALCYTIGKIEIMKLRDRFLNENKGSIKDFHHKLLINGNISFINLEKILF